MHGFRFKELFILSTATYLLLVKIENDFQIFNTKNSPCFDVAEFNFTYSSINNQKQNQVSMRKSTPAMIVQTLNDALFVHES